MTASKMFLRDFLGLVLIVSIVLALLSVLLDLLALMAYFNHETQVATVLFDESFYMLVFFVPPYFIAKYINRTDVVKAVDEYQLMKSKSEIM
ncbi:D-fructose-6-phosphate amidotransferase [Vibrio furnissii]|uniref:D-fructose-6-phosphate amidotransferase n=1 Tax=Vibrio furnissii TaxID=29494 RepID=UPI0012ADCD2F|nr:D-fructose-6-phosphate amidotransferase [Vibrio furnissii]